MPASIISTNLPSITAFVEARGGAVAPKKRVWWPEMNAETPYDHRTYCQDQIERFERIQQERPLNESELSDLDYYANELSFEECQQ